MFAPDIGGEPRGTQLIPEPARLRKVLVIGAGVAGLQTANSLLRLPGVQVLVLEQTSDVGGVWVSGYEGYGLQIPWRHFQFPDFLWPTDILPKDDFASGPEVHAYIRAYATHFGLLRYVRFNCKLLRLRWHASSREWEVLYCDTAKEKFFKTRADYTVICCGLYSQPFVPDYKGVESCAGVPRPAADFTNLSVAAGRRVVLVGSGKTALDCVRTLVNTRTASSVTMLYRQMHWPMPRSMLGIGIRSLLFNRATPTMLPPYYTEGRGAHVAHTLLQPLKRLFWRSLEFAASQKFKLPENCQPRLGLPYDMFFGGQFLDDSTAEAIRCETFATIKGEITRFVRNGVILQDGDFLPADLVLYCTGYTKTYEYFDGEVRSRLGLQKDGLYLYRNCLPPAVPHLAFIGCEVNTYCNILTHGLQALWLANVLSGRVQLPSPAEMAADVRLQQHWRRNIMPAMRSRASVVMLYGMKYHDQLIRDMGAPPRRKGLNVVAECFGAYSAEDYCELVGGGGRRMDHAQAQSEDALADDLAKAKAAAAAATAVEPMCRRVERVPSAPESQSAARAAAKVLRHLKGTNHSFTSAARQGRGALRSSIDVGALGGSGYSGGQERPPMHDSGAMSACGPASAAAAVMAPPPTPAVWRAASAGAARLRAAAAAVVAGGGSGSAMAAEKVAALANILYSGSWSGREPEPSKRFSDYSGHAAGSHVPWATSSAAAAAAEGYTGGAGGSGGGVIRSIRAVASSAGGGSWEPRDLHDGAPPFTAAPARHVCGYVSNPSSSAVSLATGEAQALSSNQAGRSFTWAGTRPAPSNSGAAAGPSRTSSMPSALAHAAAAAAAAAGSRTETPRILRLPPNATYSDPYGSSHGESQWGGSSEDAAASMHGAAAGFASEPGRPALLSRGPLDSPETSFTSLACWHTVAHPSLGGTVVQPPTGPYSRRAPGHHVERHPSMARLPEEEGVVGG